MPPSNVPPQPANNPMASMPPTGAPGQPAPAVPPSGKPKWLWPVIIAVVVLLAAGVAAYFLMMKPASQTSTDTNTGTGSSNTQSTSGSSQSSQSSMTTTSLTTTDSPNDANGTISFTHPASWKVTKETQSDVEHTIIKSALGNSVDMYARDSVGGACEEDNITYTLVKKITTQNAAYVFTEYKATGQTEVLSLQPNFNKKPAAHQALAEGQSGTGVCQNMFSYPIAKDIQVTLKNTSGKEATYNDLKADTDFITMLKSFNVVDK